MSIQRELQKARDIRAAIIAEGEDDPELLRDMVEGETDLKGVLEWSIRKYADECTFQVALKERIDAMTKRLKSASNRAERMKSIMREIMETWGIDKHKGIDGTVSLKWNQPKPVVIDENLVPDRFVNLKREIRKADINEAIKNGEIIEGVSMDNGSTSIAVRMN